MALIARYFDPHNALCARMSERARLVLAVADQFAMEQGVGEIEPAHMLRGLASVGCGVGRSALQGLGIDLFDLLPAIRQLTPRHHGMPALERNFSPRGQAVLTAARQASADLSHRYVGTEHLVLGLLAEPSTAADFLMQRGATHEAVMAEVKRLLGMNG